MTQTSDSQSKVCYHSPYNQPLLYNPQDLSPQSASRSNAQHLPDQSIYQILQGRYSGPPLALIQRQLLAKARLLKIQSIFSCLLTLTFLFTILWLVFLLPLGLVGFFAAKKFSRLLTVCYAIFTLAVMLIRIAMLVLFPQELAIVLMAIAMALEVVCVLRIAQFYRLLWHLTLQQLRECRQASFGRLL
jgi:hypothetical protein